MREHDDMKVSGVENWKRNFNIAYALCVMHQRALTVPMRKNFGTEALGLPCLLALIMMVLWATFSRDYYMWCYTGVWLVFFTHRRVQSLKLAQTQRIYSQYDGWPVDWMRLIKDENKAKLIVEPFLVTIAGLVALWVYQAHGWDVRGLPYFLLGGCFTLPMIELAKQTMWKRKTRQMMDSRLEQEQVMNDFRETWGE